VPCHEVELAQSDLPSSVGAGADAGEAQTSEDAGSDATTALPPNPADADVLDQDAASGEDDDSLGEAWSCPSKPPELW